MEILDFIVEHWGTVILVGGSVLVIFRKKIKTWLAFLYNISVAKIGKKNTDFAIDRALEIADYIETTLLELKDSDGNVNKVDNDQIKKIIQEAREQL